MPKTLQRFLSRGVSPRRAMRAIAVAAAALVSQAHAAEYVWLGGSHWHAAWSWSVGGVAVPSIPGDTDSATIVSVGAGLLSGASVGGLTLIDAEITGQSLNVLGPAVLSGSRQSGNWSTTEFHASVAWQGDATHTIAARRTVTIMPSGVANWGGNTVSGGNSIVFDTIDRAELRNRGVWNDSNAFDTRLGYTIGSPQQGVFQNTGVYNKLSNSRTDVGASFRSTGPVAETAVNVYAGVLSLNGGGSISRPVTIASGATLSIGNGSASAAMNISANALAGSGVLEFRGANGGARPMIEGSGSFGGTLRFGSGDATISGNLTVQSLEMVAATTGAYPTLYGAGNLTVSGPATWSAGGSWGPGTVQFNGSLELGAVAVHGGTVVTAGVTNWAGSTAVGSNGRIVNSGTWNDAATSGNFNGGGNASFVNTGTYNKLSGSTVSFTPTLLNTGTIAVRGGALGFHGGVLPFNNEGVLSVAVGASFSYVNASISGKIVNNGSLTGAGTIATRDELENHGLIEPGDGGIGTMTVQARRLTLASDSVLRFELGSAASFDQLRVENFVGSLSTVPWAAMGGQLVVVNQGYTPVIGDQFTIITVSSNATLLSATSFAGLTALGFASDIGFDITYNLRDVTLTVVAVPEPASALLLLGGLLSLAAVARRRGRGH